MKTTTIDTIVNGHRFKPEYCFVKIPSSPAPIPSMYQKTYNSMYQAYDKIIYLIEFAYNMVMRK